MTEPLSDEEIAEYRAFKPLIPEIKEFLKKRREQMLIETVRRAQDETRADLKIENGQIIAQARE